jgi:hypothetical protein
LLSDTNTYTFWFEPPIKRFELFSTQNTVTFTEKTKPLLSHKLNVFNCLKTKPLLSHKLNVFNCLKTKPLLSHRFVLFSTQNTVPQTKRFQLFKNKNKNKTAAEPPFCFVFDAKHSATN